MRPGLTIVVVVLGSLIFSACEAGDSVPAITKIEARQLPRRTVDARIMEQLSAILIPSPLGEVSSHPKHKLTSLVYWTAPTWTYVPELCRADEIVFEFEPADGRYLDVQNLNAETRVKLNGLQAKAHYHFLSVPKNVDLGAPSSDDLTSLNHRCAQLVPDESTFFSADNDHTAREGYLVLQNVLEAVRNGKMPSSFTCQSETSAQECATLIASARVETLRSVEACNVREPEWACVVVWTQTAGLTVRYSGDVGKLIEIKSVEAYRPYFIDYLGDDD